MQEEKKVKLNQHEVMVSHKMTTITNKKHTSISDSKSKERMVHSDQNKSHVRVCVCVQINAEVSLEDVTRMTCSSISRMTRDNATISSESSSVSVADVVKDVNKSFCAMREDGSEKKESVANMFESIQAKVILSVRVMKGLGYLALKNDELITVLEHSILSSCVRDNVDLPIVVPGIVAGGHGDATNMNGSTSISSGTAKA